MKKEKNKTKQVKPVPYRSVNQIIHTADWQQITNG